MDTRKLAMGVWHAGHEHAPTTQLQRVQKQFPSPWFTMDNKPMGTQVGQTWGCQAIPDEWQQGFCSSNRTHAVLNFTSPCSVPQVCCSGAQMSLVQRHPPGQEQRFHSGSQTTRAEDDSGLTRKRGATIARQANLPQNVAKFNQRKNENYPHGAADSNREDLIDWDQRAVFLESADRSCGKVFVGKDLNEAGPHGHSQKCTCTMATAGNPEGHRWLDFQVKAGATVHDTVAFLQQSSLTFRTMIEKRFCATT
jgi:hypothetical protein